ncbi:hypothetical protein ABT364_19740 [Massilia sp. SR12]
MIIRAIRFKAVTEQGDFGFAFSFARNLTVIRAGNSGGKSTFVGCLLYALGMEEVIGGKGEKALPYAVRDYIENDSARLPISSSEVLLEVENRTGNVITLRRAVKDDERSTKLIEVFESAHLTKAESLGRAKPTYLHDSGGAQLDEGFHRYLESFLELKLPKVARTNGQETKLYLQMIFAALAVEQKRGWTDYIANIPFYGVRDAKTRVAEFLLGLGVFEMVAKRNRLNLESVQIDTDWRGKLAELKSEAYRYGMALDGIPAGPSSEFDATKASVVKSGTPGVSLTEYILQLHEEHQKLSRRAEESHRKTGAETVQEIEKTTEELRSLSVLHERALSSLTSHRSSQREYEGLLKETQEDLEKNKAAAKLRTLGAKLDLELATGHCPTCHQAVDDNLLSDADSGPTMDLDMNISYLDSQSRMLKRQIAGLGEAIRELEGRTTELGQRLAGKQDYLAALRGDVSSGTVESKALVRRQVQIEIDVHGLEGLARRFSEDSEMLAKLGEQLKANQLARRGLPHSAYSADDEKRIAAFQMHFRANAGSFGYKSAPINEIEISRENLTPSFTQMELREIIRKSDVVADSSASDFVRLIWSFLLALYQTSANRNFEGNHPGLLILDEPGQHSMRVESQHALIQHLAGEAGLQSIVAASFDESDTVFKEATEGVKYHLIRWDGKLIQPLKATN